MFEGISLRATTSNIKQLSKKHHTGICLAWTTGTGKDDSLGVTRLSLDPDGLLGNFVETVIGLGGILGGVEGDGVTDIIVRVDGE